MKTQPRANTINAFVIHSMPIVEEGSESPETSELVDRMLEYQAPSHLTAEMDEAVDEVIKYMKIYEDNS